MIKKNDILLLPATAYEWTGNTHVLNYLHEADKSLLCLKHVSHTQVGHGWPPIVVATRYTALFAVDAFTLLVPQTGIAYAYLGLNIPVWRK